MIAEKVCYYAAQEGLEQAEVYQTLTHSIRFNILEQNVHEFVVSDKTGISLRGTYDGRCAGAYTEKTDDKALKALAQRCRQLAGFLESEDTVLFTEGKEPLRDDRHDPRLSQLSIEDKISYVKKLEKTVLSLDPRIRRVSRCAYQEVDSENRLMNTLGLDGERKSSLGLITLSVIAAENEEQVNSFGWRIIKDLDDNTLKELAQEVAEEATGKLGAVRIPSAKMAAIIREDAASDLVGSLWSMFSAEQIRKELSVMKGKQGQKVMSELITLVDDPQMKDGVCSCDFDDEGVLTEKTVIVDKGVFLNPLYDRKNALKENRRSTGNGFKNGCASPVQISPTNLIVENGEQSLDEMIASIDEGVLITELQGLHAGLNPLTTDFSLQASGYKIEKGKKAYPVHLITIAANYIEMMNSIVAVGNDGRQGLDGVSCPSLQIESLSISGE